MSAPQTVTITVTGTNDLPVAKADTQTTGENATLTSQVPAATDVDGTVESYQLATGVGQGNGSLSFNSDGSYTFNPGTDFDALAAGQSRDVTFTYTATDNNGGVSAPQTVTITVTGTNDAPVAKADTQTTGENQVLEGSVPAATDVDGTVSSYQLATDVGQGNGSLSFNSDGSYTFNPGTDFDSLKAGESRNVSFAYTATDNDGGVSEPQTVTIKVTGTNDAPVANDDSYTTYGNLGGLYSEYFAYQEGADADGPNLSSVSQAQAFIDEKGTPDATFVASSLFYNYISGNLANPDNLKSFLGADADSLSTETPATGTDAILRMRGVVELQAGSYSFKILSDDGYQVKIDGKPVATVDHNQSPATNEHSFTVAQGGTHAIEIVYWDQGEQAIFQPELKFGDGEYSPLGDFVVDSPLTTAEDTAIYLRPGDLLANDTDVEGDTLSVTSVGNASHGSVSFADGAIVFTPEANYNGPATFEYTISDGQGGSDTATVTLLVTPVNDAPVAVVDTGSTGRMPSSTCPPPKVCWPTTAMSTATP